MTETPQRERWIDTIIFWLLAGALFFAIALLPNVLFALFFGSVAVHLIVIATCSLVLLLLSMASNFRSLGRSLKNE